MIRLYAMMLLIASAALHSAGSPTKVVCIGNSITYGYGIELRDSLSYPAVLARLLGAGYEVGNFGHSGATLLRHGHRPYTSLPEWRQALQFHPDIAVIHLGVNDTDPRDWPLYGDEFVSDYVALIDTLREVNPRMRIIVANLSPLRSSHYRYRSGTHAWRLDARHTIENVAAAAGVELIDFDSPLRDRQNLITDGIHPNAEGAALLAREVERAITGRYGPLRLPQVWQSGMVVQRDRPIKLRGRANARARVNARVNGGTAFTTAASPTGEWVITLPPFVTGAPYTITVTDGADTIRLTDILAGDLWVASGQSNMAFPLISSRGGAEAAATSADPLLRIYKQEPVAYTNAERWSDSIIAAVDTLGYYRPAKWVEASAATVEPMSAIAYYFGRGLRSQLGVPVGIIDNAVGGSTLESWIDITTLEAGMPEILVNWRANDYLQPWAQRRAVENAGPDPVRRHPYEPSYLYSAAIRDLEGLAVKGVIWYQGESNAHNTMLYERLFPLWVDSWRTAFADPQMPIHTVQLSSINRSSWPVFRDAQRRLADEIPGVTITVSSDLGDSLDVHPTDKCPIGERLALQALRSPGEPPLFGGAPQAQACASEVILTFAEGTRPVTSDGLAPATFEVAETDGVYVPATATADGCTIRLSYPRVTTPRYVRYGWQPFTRANVINLTDSLPLSTFKITVEPDSSYIMEEGFEIGVSAPFAGNIANRIILAGGCNFPGDAPLASDAVKRYYSGIYELNPATCQWSRTATLPIPLAYGVSATVPEGIVIAGGTSYDGAHSEAWLLGESGVSPLPSLPVTVDNASAAAIGSVVYLAGGNQNGKPSRQVWRLDINHPDKGWQKVSRMPGTPRTQPVMAASGTSLYIWGGFAPACGKEKPTLSCDGLCFDTATGRWTSLEAPPDGDGHEISLSGGAARTLRDGRILVCGGVNKDIFLNALTHQPADYLMHPVEWYKFNPRVMVYSPLMQQWQQLIASPDAARAGAVILTGSDGTLLLYGGEIKPRIRTSQIYTLPAIPQQ